MKVKILVYFKKKEVKENKHVFVCEKRDYMPKQNILTFNFPVIIIILIERLR